MGLMIPVMCMAIIAILSISLQAAAGESEMNIVFYMHDHLMGRNVTAFPVAGFNGTSSNAGKFGTLVVISDIVTCHPYENSNPASDDIVGRAQGTYVKTNPDTDLDYFMVFTLIFQNLKYSNSTLEIQGTDRFDQPQREYAVVGGRGKLRLARGYVIATSESTTGTNAVLKLNTTLLIPR